MAVQNAENGVVWGSYGALKVTGNATIRYSAYDFLFDFNRNYVYIFYRFRDILSYLSKVADFDQPTCICRPPQWVITVEFRGDLWHQKLESLAVVWCCLCHPTFIRFSRTPTCDRQTRTDSQRPMASTAHA